jgi:3-phosphoglycerate kinase
LNKLSIDRLDIKNKKIFMRADFNVPLNENLEITDDARIVAALPTIKKIIDEGASLVLSSHLGRPKGEFAEKFSLKPVAKRLEELLSKKVTLASDSVGLEVKMQKEALEAGEILLLENVRFHNEEKKNDEKFAKELVDGCDIFINDAFGTAHRAHASTTGVAKFVKTSASGYLIQKEIEFLGKAVTNPERPFTAIIGGAKISGKIDVIKNLFDKVDNIIIGGGMIFTFYKAMGLNIGTSLVEEDRVEMAKEILATAKEKNVRFMLPTDIIVADKFNNDAQTKIVDYTEIPDGWMGLDIADKSIKQFEDVLSESKTVVWNGPMGAFEMPNFAKGTEVIAKKLAEITKKGATTIVGGGDSAAAVKSLGLTEELSHVSTGGGASLEYLEGKELPGILALTDK